ncbi:dUTP diphosphatase [Thermaerobacillus caldiproteolyticus]|uniref:dUTP diphosphatase n=1 Tax=Thermaerobacillus caldiproteolyticus TaxID=247480 RepID=UPI0018F2462B|nr:dUTP diphosphatase [Anoxybacillus caldiproteolyticus]
MNLQKLFELQRKLDEHIEQEHPRQEGEDRLAKKILALLVELGELAREWRGFKYWSKDQEPRTFERVPCPTCNPNGGRYRLFQDGTEDPQEFCETCAGYKCIDKNPLLEEYVDCLHFILSIGLETGKDKEVEFQALYVDGDYQDIVMQFNVLFDKVGDFYAYKTKGNYQIVLSLFLALGEMLGFTWEQIEEAYMKKNAENHARQENGY